MSISTVSTPNKSKNKQLVLSLEGNIGAGKSTFLNLLKQNNSIDFELIQEPVSEFQNVANKGINLLDLFYKDTKRWCYALQTLSFYMKLKNIENAKKNANNSLFIAERSVYTDKEVFCLNASEVGTISEVEYEIYKEWFDYFIKKMGNDIDGIIYLRTQPETCKKRCNKRGREEEKSIPYEYFQQIHEKHENWLMNPGKLSLPVLVIDTDKEFEENETRRLEIFNQVCKFLEGMQKY